MTARLLTGDCREVLTTLPDASVQCAVTSPPYYGLRNYGVDGQIGLESSVDEYVAEMVAVFREVKRVLRPDGTVWCNMGDSFGPNKQLLGAPWRLAFALQQPYYSGRIKNEHDRIWLAAMIDAEGCMFIHKRKVGQNNGQGYARKSDSYGVGLEISNSHRSIIDRCMEITGKGSVCTQGPEQNYRRKQELYRWNMRTNECRDIIREVYPYLVGKQHEARLMLGCPSSGPVAEAAHEALKLLHNGGHTTVDFPEPASMYEPGWILRSDIIWAKKNCMPESVRDRPTKSHEYIFLMSKSARYFWDAEAVREEAEYGRREWSHTNGNMRRAHSLANVDSKQGLPSATVSGGDPSAGRNIRSVWTIATHPYAEAHFATFPPELAERCIKAGTSERGCCSACGAPWVRVVEREGETPREKANRVGFNGHAAAYGENPQGLHHAGHRGDVGSIRTTGWRPSCACDADVTPCVVMDPFAGAGTTSLVSERLGRDSIGIELSPAYVAMAEKRIRDDCPMFAAVEVV